MVVSLDGSHRLPIPIARCVQPLAEAVRVKRVEEGRSGADVSLPQSRKAAVIGVRPIVVVGPETELVEQISRIHDTYRDYLFAEAGSTNITVCESDAPFVRSLTRAGLPASSSTVKRIKGLERGFMVWSVRQAIDSPADIEEVAYTILTRTSCLLVLAIDPERVPESHIRALRGLDVGQLLFWTEASDGWWRQNCAAEAVASGVEAPAAVPPAMKPSSRTARRVAPEEGVELTLDLEMWNSGAPCDKHEFGWCAVCKPTTLPAVVYKTATGSAFHRDLDCPALVAGQSKARHLGFDPAEAKPTTPASAVRRNASACLVCLPRR